VLSAPAARREPLCYPPSSDACSAVRRHGSSRGPAVSSGEQACAAGRRHVGIGLLRRTRRLGEYPPRPRLASCGDLLICPGSKHRARTPGPRSACTGLSCPSTGRLRYWEPIVCALSDRRAAISATAALDRGRQASSPSRYPSNGRRF
jgi:hypothetical protein